LSRVSDADSSDDLSEVPVMSLKMRLFKGRKRKELCSMFDSNHLSKTMSLDFSSDSDKENEQSSAENEQSSVAETGNSSSARLDNT
jgi:hypothetical protein